MASRLPPAAEGTIQFDVRLRPPRPGTFASDRVAELGAWREICRRLGILGQTPDRYEGLGYGNLSCRDAARPAEFVITASQTGAASALTTRELVRIVRCDPERFAVDAEGVLPPSSETLTHAMVYAADPAIHWVMHVHCPDIWNRSARLGLPATDRDVPYGSPAMASAVSDLAAAHPDRPLVFTTAGHEDGVFACGTTATETGLALVLTLARALT
jgi:L-ribulose-5-phosphate 4-epimerase